MMKIITFILSIFLSISWVYAQINGVDSFMRNNTGQISSMDQDNPKVCMNCEITKYENDKILTETKDDNLGSGNTSTLPDTRSGSGSVF